MARVFVPSSKWYNEKIPLVFRLFGCFGWERGLLRFNWGEIGYKRFGFGIGYSVYHDTAHIGLHLLWLNLYLKVPVLIRERPGTEDWCASYGMHTFGDAIHFNWRTKCKIISLPWAFGSAIRWDVFDASGNKRKKISQYDDGPFEDGRYVETWLFIYVLRSGNIQNRTATIHGEEMEWRLKWFPWLPWPRKIHRSIAISFDDEVGERSGSWKGGVTGCSFEWRDGESMKGCLLRMQHEREFC